MAQIVQKNFAAGEVSPDIEVRNDFVSNQTGLRTCRNTYIRRQGGLSRRYGSKFVSEVGHQSEKKARLIPFQFTVGDSVIIEMGEGYFRFYKNGALICFELDSIVSVATDIIETSSPHGLDLDDEVYLTLSFDNKEFIREKFVVTSVPDSTHFEVSDIFLDSVDLSVYGSFNSGQILMPIEISNPFLEDELFDVRFSQVGDLMTMVHFNHGVYDMIRYSDASWSFLKNELSGNTNVPGSLSISKDGSNSGDYSYEFLVSSVDPNGYESLSIYEKITGVKQLDGIDATRNLTLSIGYSGNTRFFRIYMREVPYVLSSGYTYSDFKGFGLYDITEAKVPLSISYIVDGNFDIDESQMPLAPEITGDTISNGNRGLRHNSLDDTTTWSRIVYDPSEGFFADGNTNLNDAMSSIYGQQWIPISKPYVGAIRGIAYGNGMYVRVGSGAGDHITTSPDLTTWTARTNPEANDWNRVIWNGSMFVAVAGNGTNRVLRSADGITWTAGPAAAVSQWEAVAYGGGLFVAVASNGTDRIMTSPDAVTWTAQASIEQNTWQDIAYGNGMFVAVAATGINKIMVSYDGINWFLVLCPTSEQLLTIEFGNGYFLIGGANVLLKSSDGLNWEIIPGGENARWVDIAFGAGTFVGVSNTGSRRVINYNPETQEVSFKPSAVSTSKERRWYGGAQSGPGVAFGSKVGYYNDFKKRYETAIVASDPVKANTPSENMGKIMHLLDYKRLFAFTDTSEVVFKGIGESGAISATDLPNPEKISENGISRLRPLIVDKSVLYVQARGSIIRDMMAEITLDSYPGDEISLFSAHLVDNYELVDWAFQKTPHPIVWIVRNDGVMLSITYNQTQQIKGFARHDFLGGEVESVACVSEDQYDVLYAVVKRTVNGFTKRYIETIVTKEPVDLVDKTFMDSYLTYDGRNKDQNHNMRVGTFTDYNYGTALRLQSLEDYFDSSHVGKYIFMYRDGEALRLRIDSIVDGFEAVAYANKNVPTAFQVTGMSTWALAVEAVSGLAHLEGEAVCVLGDGNVLSSPLNDEYPTISIQDGVAILDVPVAVAHVGLPYVSDIEPLDFDTAERLSSMADKPLLTNRFNARVLRTSAFFAGTKEPIGDNYLEGLNEVKVREYEGYDEANELKTGLAEVAIESSFSIGGRVFIRQVDPLPLNILSIFPDTQTN